MKLFFKLVVQTLLRMFKRKPKRSSADIVDRSAADILLETDELDDSITRESESLKHSSRESEFDPQTGERIHASVDNSAVQSAGDGLFNFNGTQGSPAPVGPKLRSAATSGLESTTATISQNNDFASNIFVGPVSQELQELQLGVLRLILGKFGVPYVPAFAIEIQRSQNKDAIASFIDFIRMVGIDHELIISQSSAAELEKFIQIIDILVESEDLERHNPISSIPVRRAARRGVHEAEDALDKMRILATAVSRFSKPDQDALFEYRQLYSSLQLGIEDWSEWSKEKTDAVIKKILNSERAENQYRILLEKIEAIEVLRKKSVITSLRDQRDLEELYNIAIELRGFLSAKDNAEVFASHITDSEDGLKLLEYSCERIELLHSTLTEGQLFVGIKDVDLQDAWTTLKIKPTSSLIAVKSAFRKLAKIYHPDATGSKKADSVKFAELSEAYESISRFINVRTD